MEDKKELLKSILEKAAEYAEVYFNELHGLLSSIEKRLQNIEQRLDNIEEKSIARNIDTVVPVVQNELREDDYHADLNEPVEEVKEVEDSQAEPEEQNRQGGEDEALNLQEQEESIEQVPEKMSEEAEETSNYESCADNIDGSEDEEVIAEEDADAEDDVDDDIEAVVVNDNEEEEETEYEEEYDTVDEYEGGGEYDDDDYSEEDDSEYDYTSEGEEDDYSENESPASQPDWYDWEVDYPKESVMDLASSLAINDKMQFVHELFNGDEAKLIQTIKYLDIFNNFRDVKSYIMEAFANWDFGSEAVYNFMMHLRRKFK